MRKLALALASYAFSRSCAVPGIFGGLLAGALIAGIASSAYGYGRAWLLR